MTPKITIPTEVRDLLEQQPQHGVAVEDDSTHAHFVLLPFATYQRWAPLISHATEPDPNEFLPLAHEAFAADWDAPGMEAYDDYDHHKRTSS